MGWFKIYDIEADPLNPKLLGQFECEDGPGVHRSFYNGGDYAYIMGSKRNFRGYILRIVDISDPTNPTEVGAGGQMDSISVTRRHLTCRRLGLSHL